MAKALGRTHFLYTQYINRLHARSGHLWQSRFYSCALDDTHLWAALSYVERNPVRARMVRTAWSYHWSSAAAHVSIFDRSGLLDMKAWAREWNPRGWRSELGRPEETDHLTKLRRNTHTGRPLGSDRFLSKFETALGRRLRALPVGRPPKRPKLRRRKAKREWEEK